MNSGIFSSIAAQPFNKLVSIILLGQYVNRTEGRVLPELFPEECEMYDLSDEESTLLNLSSALEGIAQKNKLEMMIVEDDLPRSATRLLAAERAIRRQTIVDQLFKFSVMTRFPDLDNRRICQSPAMGVMFVPKKNLRQYPAIDLFGDGWSYCPRDFITDLSTVIHGNFVRPGADILKHFVGATHCCKDRCDVEDDRTYLSLNRNPDLWQYVWLLAKISAFRVAFVAKDEKDRDRWMDTKSTAQIELLDSRALVCAEMAAVVHNLLLEESVRLNPTMQGPSDNIELVVTNDGFIIQRLTGKGVLTGIARLAQG